MPLDPGVPSRSARPSRTERLLFPARTSRPRERQRGAAAIEFALMLVFLTPLVLGMLDFGKFMYISVMTTEAARMGARELARTATNGGCGTASANAAITKEQGTLGAASLYLAQINMGAGGASGSQWTSITATCLSGGSPVMPNPTWQLVVQVDYQPTIGYLTAHNLMPKGGGTTARAKATMVMRGRF